MDWRKNLYDFEEQPPEHIWDKVSDELAADAPASLREGLYAYQEVPPAAVWDKVREELGWEKPVRVLWPAGSWKIATAAAAATLLFGAFYFNRDAGTPKVAASVIQPLEPAIPRQTPAPLASVTAPAVDSLPAQEQTSMAALPGKTVSGPVKSRTRKPAPDRNYIYFTSSEGDLRRLSYKLEKLLPAIRSNRKNEMVSEWTSALERSTFVPSGNNFFDIVEMVKMAEEKQQ